MVTKRNACYGRRQERCKLAKNIVRGMAGRNEVEVNPARTTATEDPGILVHVKDDVEDAYEDTICDVPIETDDGEFDDEELNDSTATVRSLTNRTSVERRPISSCAARQPRPLPLQRRRRSAEEPSPMLDAPKQERRIRICSPNDFRTHSALASMTATAPLESNSCGQACE